MQMEERGFSSFHAVGSIVNKNHSNFSPRNHNKAEIVTIFKVQLSVIGLMTCKQDKVELLRFI